MLTLDLSKEMKINCIQFPVWAWQHNKSRQCNEKKTSVLLGIKSESADDKLKVITPRVLDAGKGKFSIRYMIIYIKVCYINSIMTNFPRCLRFSS